MGTNKKTEDRAGKTTKEEIMSDGSASAFRETEGLYSGGDKDTSDARLDQLLDEAAGKKEEPGNKSQAPDNVY